MIFNVLDAAYGATGNGTTDDTPSVNLAIAAATAAGGGIVYFPSSRLSGTTFVQAIYAVHDLQIGDHIVLKGDGPQVTTLLLNDSTKPLVSTVGFSTDTGTTHTGKKGFAILEMTLDGSRGSSTSVQTAVKGLVQIYGHGWRLENLVIESGFSSGLWTENGEPFSSEPLEGRQGTLVNLNITNHLLNGWVHLGPTDSVATRVFSYGNGRAFGTDRGEANIWIGARRPPVVSVAVNGAKQVTGISSGGWNYEKGPIAMVVANDYVGAVGYGIVDATGVVTGIDWILQANGLPPNQALTGYLNGNRSSAPDNPLVFTVTTGPTGQITSTSGFTSGTNSGFVKWPTFDIYFEDSAHNKTPAVGDRAKFLPIILGRSIVGAIRLSGGSNYTTAGAELKVEIKDATGAVPAFGVAVALSGSIDRIEFGYGGTLLDSAGVNVSVGSLLTATSSLTGYGSVATWTVGATQSGMFNQGERFSIDDGTVTYAPSGAGNGGGTLLQECHVYGQTFGYRLSINGVLTGCEAEGAVGANVYLEAGSSEITGLWTYNSGGYGIAAGITGSPYGIGVLLGTPFAGAQGSRIEGLAERFPLGAAYVLRTDGGLDVDLTVRGVSGRFYNLDGAQTGDSVAMKCYGAPSGTSNKYPLAKFATIYPLTPTPRWVTAPTYLSSQFLCMGVPIMFDDGGVVQTFTVPWAAITSPSDPGSSSIVWNGTAASKITLPDLYKVPKGLMFVFYHAAAIPGTENIRLLTFDALLPSKVQTFTLQGNAGAQMRFDLHPFRFVVFVADPDHLTWVMAFKSKD
ncbi:hypothetical protein BH11ARM2_BH11ARM2_09400 [soil metagenome]